MYSGGKPEYSPLLASYESSSTLFSIVNFLASTTAQVNWRLYRKATSGAEDERVEVVSHAALSVLNKPTQFDTRQDLFEAAQQHIDLTGEAWFIIERNSQYGIVIGIWLARPDRMSVVKSKDDFLLGYTYRQPDGLERPLKKEDVIQLRMPNPNDPYRGLSPVTSLLPAIDGDELAEFWQKSFFRNGAKPGGVVKLNQNMSDEQFKKLLERWEMQHRGIHNANRVAFMESGDYLELKYTQADMQFLELRNFTAEKIREAYGVSKSMLGIVDDVNRANNEAQEANYAKYKLKPRLERFKQALNNEFLPLFGTTTVGLEFDYDDIEIEDTSKVIADRDSRVQAAVALINAGADPVATMKAFNLPEIPFINRSDNGQVQN
jgi:HK97 family phage portal protein